MDVSSKFCAQRVAGGGGKIHGAYPTVTRARTHHNTPRTGVLKKAARPSSRWQDLAPSVGQWYQELDAILRALQENGFGSNGADMDKVKRCVSCRSVITILCEH